MVDTVENRTLFEGSQTRMDTLHLFGAIASIITLFTPLGIWRQIAMVGKSKVSEARGFQ